MLQHLIFLLITFLCGSLSSLVVGVVTKDAAIISSSSVISKNGVAMREDFDWIRQVGEHCLVGVQGDSSDCTFLLSQLESSNRDHLLTFGRSLPSASVAHLCRRIIYKFLRSNQLKVSVLIAGWNNEGNCPSLFWLDSSGAIQEVPYAAHGEGFPFVLGLLDRKNRESKVLVTEIASEEAIMNEGNEEEEIMMSAESVLITSTGDTDNSVVESVHSIPHLSLVKKQHTQKRGKLLQMSVNEGVSTIQSCMDAVRKRALGTLGSCRIKGVTASGCKDLGYA